MLHVFFANRGLFRQPIQLRAEHSGLKFPQPVIEANDAVMKLIGQAGSTGIDVALHRSIYSRLLLITTPPSPEVISLLD